MESIKKISDVFFIKDKLKTNDIVKVNRKKLETYKRKLLWLY